MSALGFGQKVTGGSGPGSLVVPVTKGKGVGADTLTAALTVAETRSKDGKPTTIVIKSGVTVDFVEFKKADRPVIRARNLTITGEKDSKIFHRLLEFDCKESDNVILSNLTFDGPPASDVRPRDSVHLDGTLGRGPIGFWLDHCLFNAVFDLSFTANTKDLAGAPPLLLTISSCRFVNDDPEGKKRENNGALGVHGFRNKNDKSGKDRDTNTNAYASIYNNVFLKTRRRSPRSSNLALVHAFNNVLEEWGASKDPKQANGMDSGNFGLLVAEANYFKAGPMREAISVAGKGQPGRLTVPKEGDRLENVYVKADTAVTVGEVIPLAKAYKDLKLTPPPVQPIDNDLVKQLKADAGPKN